MKGAILGPCRCQGCGEQVWWSGWWRDARGFLHRCPGGQR